MQTAIKITLLCIVLTIMGIITTSEFKDVQSDDEILYLEMTESTQETPYYMEVMGNDTTIKLGQEMTVISIDTFQGLTCVTLK